MSASRPLAAVTEGGHGDGEQRVDQRDPRNHQRAAQAGLDPVRRDGEHRVGGHLRPGARGGGHRDAGHGGPGYLPAGPDHLQVVQRVAAVAQQHGHGLAGIDDAAAADRGDHVGTVLACGGDRGPGQLDRRLGVDREHRGRQPQAGQQPTVPCRVRARDHQHPRAQGGQHSRQFLRPPGTGHDAAGGGELEARHRHGGVLTQPALQGEHRGEPGRLPGFGHHLGDRVPPDRVVRRQLVRRRRVVVPVDLDQHHVLRVGLVLQHVEAQHSGLAQRRPRVDQRRGQEVLGPSRPDPDMNMNYQHEPILLRSSA